MSWTFFILFIKTVSSDSAFVKFVQSWHMTFISQNYSFAATSEVKHLLHLGGFSDTVMLWMVRVIKGYNMSQHYSQRGQALILSCPSSYSFNPHDYRLYLAIDFSLLWAFNLRRWMKREGGRGR